MYAIVYRSGFDTILYSKHKSKEVADYRANQMNEKLNHLYANDKFSVIELSKYRVGEIFGKVMALPK